VRKTASGSFVVLDIVRFRGGPDEVEAAIVNTATHDGRNVTIRLPEDPGQASKQQVLYYSRKLSGYTIVVEKEGASKAQRALPVASQCNVGNLAVLRNMSHAAAFRDELAAFPSGTHDDMVDALSGAFGVVGVAPPPLRFSPEMMARIGAR
jgi:predicted phage terminase large subunit-like protein